MYTVLLADDEQPILDTLLSVIPWQQFGVDTLLTAHDGQQAWQLICSRQVDLLITDIRMPHMDGMELLKRVSSQYPAIHSILLTAYSEFEYAREALRLGVENYLLKPFQQQEMEETIEKALDNIYASRNSSTELFRNNVLMRWVNGSIGINELSERASLLGLNIYLPSFCVVYMHKKQLSGSLSSYRALCQELLDEDYSACRFLDDNGRHIFIIGASRPDTAALSRLFARAAQDADVAELASVIIGPWVDDCAALSESYQAVCRIADSADLDGKGFLLLTAEENASGSAALTDELLSLFREASEERRKEGFLSLAERLSLSGGGQETPKELLMEGLARLFAQEFPSHRQLSDQLRDRFRLFSASAPEHFTAAAAELLEYGFLLYRYEFEALSPIIQYAIDYIHKNYASGLSIREFCVKYRTNPDYLGFLFKKETGIFFNNYLSQYRICRSMTLLRDSDIRISDIAAQVGFSSASYFISCFKKQVGMSPIRYRTFAQNRKNEEGEVR